MNRLLFFICMIAVFTSCSKPTGIKELLITSDSAAINFFKGDGSMDTVYQFVMIRDKKALESLAGYIESGTIKIKPCGYDGSLHFFKNNMVIKDIDFRMNQPDCMHFSFVINGQLFTTKLSIDAKRFLETVKSKLFY